MRVDYLLERLAAVNHRQEFSRNGKLGELVLMLDVLLRWSSDDFLAARHRVPRCEQ